MNSIQAMKALDNGEKLTLAGWGKRGYIYKDKDNVIRNQDGVVYNIAYAISCDFTQWEVFEDNKNKLLLEKLHNRLALHYSDICDKSSWIHLLDDHIWFALPPGNTKLAGAIALVFSEYCEENPRKVVLNYKIPVSLQGKESPFLFGVKL
jgi:hypothetical protein